MLVEIKRLSDHLPEDVTVSPQSVKFLGLEKSVLSIDKSALLDRIRDVIVGERKDFETAKNWLLITQWFDTDTNNAVQELPYLSDISDFGYADDHLEKILSADQIEELFSIMNDFSVAETTFHVQLSPITFFYRGHDHRGHDQ